MEGDRILESLANDLLDLERLSEQEAMQHIQMEGSELSYGEKWDECSANTKSRRFVTVNDTDTTHFIEENRNKNTNYKTKSDIKIFSDWASSVGEFRPIETISAFELDSLLARFYLVHEPPKTLTDEPWRKPSVWSEELKQALKAEIQQLDPQRKPNLLMLGPVGAGKSSFIDSILCIGKGRRVGIVPTGDTGNSSWTLDFNPVSPITEQSSHYKSNPDFNDQIHCVIFVVSALTIHAGIPPAYVQKIKQLQDKIRREHVPRILILTKVEELCHEVADDITKLFRSVKVHEAVKTASEVFGIEQASIHPVKNYQIDFNIETKTNIPLLLALRQTM